MRVGVMFQTWCWRAKNPPCCFQDRLHCSPNHQGCREPGWARPRRVSHLPGLASPPCPQGWGLAAAAKHQGSSQQGALLHSLGPLSWRAEREAQPWAGGSAHTRPAASRREEICLCCSFIRGVLSSNLICWLWFSSQKATWGELWISA